jgi:hypothetical protein
MPPCGLSRPFRRRTPAIDADLEIRRAPGWHAYWRAPGDAGFPLTIDWKGSTNFVGAEITWPAPARLIVGDLAAKISTGRNFLISDKFRFQNRSSFPASNGNECFRQ